MGIFEDAYATVFGSNNSGGARQTRNGATRSYTGISGQDRLQAERVPVATDDIHTYWHMYQTVPFIRAAFNQFRDDIMANGYRVAADATSAQSYLDEWTNTAGVVEAERGQDFYKVLKHIPPQLLARGTVLLEHTPDESDGDRTAGVSFINPGTVTPYRASDTGLLLRPEDTQYEGAKLTDDGEAAAYVQFDGTNDERRLTLDDVTRIVYDGDTDAVFGTSPIAPVAPRIIAIREKLQDIDRAVAQNAWKSWFVAFGHETVKNDDGSETVIEWDDDDMSDFMTDLESVEPGDIEGHDGTIDIQSIGGDVADITGQLAYETHYILTAMPAPTYSIGFEKDINQFVVNGQEERHEQRVNQFQGDVKRELRPLAQSVLTEAGKDPKGANILLEPSEEDSPILNMSDGEVERIERFASAFKQLSGGEPRTLLPDDVIREDILQFEGVDAPEEGPGENGLSAEDLKDMNPEDMLQQAANEQ